MIEKKTKAVQDELAKADKAQEVERAEEAKRVQIESEKAAVVDSSKTEDGAGPNLTLNDDEREPVVDVFSAEAKKKAEALAAEKLKKQDDAATSDDVDDKMDVDQASEKNAAEGEEGDNEEAEVEDEEDAEVDVADAIEQALGEEVDDVEDEEEVARIVAQNKRKDAVQRQNAQRERLNTIRAAFRKSVVPTLKKLLWEKTKEDGESKGGGASDQRQSMGDRQLSSASRKKQDELRGTIRIPVVGCLIHILKHMDQRTFYREVPKLLASVMEALKSRLLESRDAARKALCECVNALGPAWYVYLNREIQNHLSRGGYQTAVCVYTGHALLMSVLRSSGVANVEKTAAEKKKEKVEKLQASSSSNPKVNARKQNALPQAIRDQAGLTGTLDAALPEVRNLIALELSRVSDPDRTEEELQEMKSKGSVLEAKKIRGPDIVAHLASHATPSLVLKEVLEYLYYLLQDDRIDAEHKMNNEGFEKVSKRRSNTSAHSRDGAVAARVYS